MICARRNFYTQTPLHTGAFTQKKHYTQKLLLTDALYKNVFARKKAHRRFYPQNLLHRETFAQNNNFYTKKLLHKQILTDRNLYTQTWTAPFFYTPKLCPEQFLCKIFRTETFTHIFFTHNIFYIDVCTHRCFYTYTLKLVHAARFYTQPTSTQRGFASPSLITYLLCASQVYLKTVATNPLLKHFEKYGLSKVTVAEQPGQPQFFSHMKRPN